MGSERRGDLFLSRPNRWYDLSKNEKEFVKLLDDEGADSLLAEAKRETLVNLPLSLLVDGVDSYMDYDRGQYPRKADPIVYSNSSGQIYTIFPVPSTFNRASAIAKHIGGKLVELETKEEASQLVDAINAMIDSYIMLDGTDNGYWDWCKSVGRCDPISDVLTEFKTREEYIENWDDATKKELSKTTAADGGGSSYVWLGGSDAQVEGDWQWLSSGKAISKTRPEWGSGKRGSEPDKFKDNGKTTQNHLALGLENWPSGSSDGEGYGNAGQWNDLNGSNKLWFVVEGLCVGEKRWTKIGRQPDPVLRDLGSPNHCRCLHYNRFDSFDIDVYNPLNLNLLRIDTIESFI